MSAIICTCSCGHQHLLPAPTCGSTTLMNDNPLRCEERVGHGGKHYAWLEGVVGVAWTDEDAVLYHSRGPIR
jgi:hypothetical protein